MSFEELETKLLRGLMERDARIWARRMQSIHVVIRSNTDDGVFGADDDASFYEPWETRKKRKAAERGVIPLPPPKPAGETYMGKPCKHGHAGLRYKKGNTCIECAKLRSRAQPRKGLRGIWKSIELADTARTMDGYQCIVCRKPFVPKTRPGESEPRRPPLYCSATCNQRAHRVRRENAA